MLNEPFEIPVTYKDRELLFASKLVTRGFSHQFEVEVDGQQVFFEPDDNGSYRALMDAASREAGTKIPAGLLQAIAAAIEGLVQ